MNTKLISIVGIDSKVEQILKKRTGISTIKQFYDATRNSEGRKILAEKSQLSLATITNWAVQAELLRIEGLSPNMAYDLIEAGVYSVEQIRSMSDTEICEKVKSNNVYSSITKEHIASIKRSKVREAKRFDTSTIVRELVETETTAPSMYTDLSDIITELGKGIAQAQRALDESSINIQNEILSNDRLYGMGLQATWYVMPEAEFTLKMDYVVTEEKSSTGKILSSKIRAMPINATYNNLFKTEKKEESTIRLKFVPIPAADRMLERKYMPDLSNVKTIEEIIELMDSHGIKDYKISPQEANDWPDKNITLVSQSPSAGTLLLIGDLSPVITVKL